MSNSLAFRDPATLAFANLDDRRRLAVSELRMLVEDGVTVHPAAFGQVILKHVLVIEDEDVNAADLLLLGDQVERRVFGGR